MHEISINKKRNYSTKVQKNVNIFSDFLKGNSIKITVYPHSVSHEV